MLQNVLLIWIVFVLIRSVYTAGQAGLSTLFVILAAGFLFVLLEEVDYGSYMKTAATVALISVFLVAPFLLRNSRFQLVRLFTPSRWAAASILLFALLSRLAHLLDGAGFGQINGIPGNLENNISEFREFNMYYLFLIYFAELYQRLQRTK